MPASRRRDYNIDGAPYEIGQEVRVLNNPNNDSTFETLYVGLCGTVVYFEYDCGCGQTYPTDPMIGVRFTDQTVEEFWREEVQSVP